MGYRIDSYSLDELSKISMPDVVVPSLFWVVPVGDWHFNELEELWRLFTQYEGVCKDFGLILMQGDLGKKTHTDLDLLGGANLQHLMPKGIDISRNSGGKHLLFLSGGYPQPGWGVLVYEVDTLNFLSFIEELVNKIILNIEFGNKLNDIKGASKAYHQLYHSVGHVRDRDRQFDDHYRSAYIKASEAQWELGPKFLVQLEQACLLNNIKSKSIAWDQPRMIGWKLWCSGIEFSLEDIHFTATSLIGRQSYEMNMAGDGASHVSGSHFTDYVHFLASQDINKSSRAVTCEFVNQLTRLSDRLNLFRFYSKDEYPGSLSPELIIDQLITILGWPNDNAQLVPSLASCVNSVGKVILSGNDIRIILESYCRDFLDVLTSQGNYSVDNLLELVINHRPDYRYNDGSWDRHVSRLSFGSAIICIEALCIHQFKRQQQTVCALVSSIKKLGIMANARSHFSETNSQNEWNSDHVGKLIKEILGLTHDLISEMPWHFTETQSNGTHPKVLTGNAWSHSHPNPRLIRVLLWRGTERVYPNQLIWNPRLTNPVMTDPTIIKRPR